jgi:uncharacterized protein YggT (Ycf19 family)
MQSVAQLVTVALKLFVLGLIVRVVLSWVHSTQTRKVELFLDKIYEPLLRPLRRVIKPIKLNTSPPSSLDLAPLALVLAVWWLVHPLLMWILL